MQGVGKVVLWSVTSEYIMKLSTKGRYAVTAMMYLVLYEGQGAISLAEISRRQGISLSYLEQLFAKLRKGGLVKGVRGPGGGYQLSRSPTEINIADIIIAVDSKIDVTRCGGRENCHHGERCLTHELWVHLSKQIAAFLSQISLAEITARAKQGQEQHTTLSPLAATDSSTKSGSGAASLCVESRRLGR